ncbi:hypothetical protein RUND412_004833 [Rhizina undulata]
MSFFSELLAIFLVLSVTYGFKVEAYSLPNTTSPALIRRTTSKPLTNQQLTILLVVLGALLFTVVCLMGWVYLHRRFSLRTCRLRHHSFESSNSVELHITPSDELETARRAARWTLDEPESPWERIKRLSGEQKTLERAIRLSTEQKRGMFTNWGLTYTVLSQLRNNPDFTLADVLRDEQINDNEAKQAKSGTVWISAGINSSWTPRQSMLTTACGRNCVEILLGGQHVDSTGATMSRERGSGFSSLNSDFLNFRVYRGRRHSSAGLNTFDPNTTTTIIKPPEIGTVRPKRRMTYVDMMREQLPVFDEIR